MTFGRLRQAQPGHLYSTNPPQRLVFSLFQTMQTAELEGFVDRWINAWNTRQIDQILSLYTDDAELVSAQFLQSLGRTVVRGKTEIHQLVSQILDRAPHRVFEAAETFATDTPGRYMVMFNVTAPPLKTRLVQVWRFANGLIEKSETFLGVQEAANSATPAALAQMPGQSPLPPQPTSPQFRPLQAAALHTPPAVPATLEYDARWPLFDDASPFVERDNRQFRPRLPTTADLLNRRHESMLPAHVVAGKTMLDIGCALAATGKWVLDRQARAYVGVEPQKDYADIGAELLATYPGASIICERGVEFFASCNQRYDIVGLLGVLHGQYDPLLFIEAACQLATEYVCIENLGNDADGSAMIPRPESWMPAAHMVAGSQGFGWTISPSALATIMEHFGFVPDMAPFYTDPGPSPSTRYAWRFKRVGGRGATAGDFANLIAWKSVKLAPVLAPSPTIKAES